MIQNEKRTQMFYILPKALFKPSCSGISLSAKILYALLLDRHHLSVKTNMVDENGRHYIYYTLNEIASMLSCSRAHAVKLLGELDKRSGAGLIERRKQGQGKPCMIYVHTIADSIDYGVNNTPKSENQSVTTPVSDIKDEDFLNEEVCNVELLNSTAFNSESKDCLTQDINEVEPINTDSIKNNNINTESFISDHINTEIKPDTPEDLNDMIEKIKIVKEIIKDNIEYPIAVYDFGESWTNGIVELIADVVCSSEEYIRINKRDYPQKLVADRFMNLKYNHIENVYMTMNSITSPVKNVRSYMITALYRAYETSDYWINAKAKSDIAREKNYG